MSDDPKKKETVNLAELLKAMLPSTPTLPPLPDYDYAGLLGLPAPRETQANMQALFDLIGDRPPEIQGKWYNNVEVSLDGYKFVSCRFDRCTIKIAEGNFWIEGCVFEACAFIWVDKAKRIVQTHNLVVPEAWAKTAGTLGPRINSDGTVTLVP